MLMPSSGNRSNIRLGLHDLLFDTVFGFAVVEVIVESFDRDRVDGVPSDERFDVFHIAIFRVLGAGAGPEQSLGMSSFIS